MLSEPIAKTYEEVRMQGEVVKARLLERIAKSLEIIAECMQREGK